METLKKIIERYNSIRSMNWLQSIYTDKYAFVGLGNHSINNLYPVLDYLRVSLKCICCKSADKIPLIMHKWKNVQATTSFEDMLIDQEIKGVFVSISPHAHFEIAQQILASDKAIFIEKPPCSSLTELQQLMDLEQSFVMVGMQKRYAPATKILANRLKKETLLTYDMRYLTGGYPEGNPLTDLFIHPLDYVCYLFGKAEIRSCEYIQGKNGITLMLTLKHEAVTGILELSTAYSWQNAKEILTVNTERGIYELNQMETLKFTPKHGLVFGIPLEKMIRRNTITEILFSRNSFVPTNVNNQIYTQGYFDEIKFFVEAVQKGSQFTPYNGFHSMYNTYILIDAINNAYFKK
ncbi:MAG: Gfo/Idh/MocA family oxidoreductase [Bacteroides sp.]|nr:Gfo/Idh/MocA family oxidoreductase [Roseburia sp.]MCM1346971.1 Gfo/Idh/MocA family oxidoreductase [Bacteroides sp.]MCM1421597.1 Gfo/Idh/MocA family oxidoreductase [Bacteroides sp.]